MPQGRDPEWLVRKQRIGPRLDHLGWPRINASTATPTTTPYRVEEYETTNGPADYALGIGPNIAGVVEAKKLTVGPQNVLPQAERYSLGATSNPLNFGGGFRVPFLYSTNGKVIWFRGARNPLNRSRRVADFHTPAALSELMTRDFGTAVAALNALPNNHPRLRPYTTSSATSTRWSPLSGKEQP